MARGSRSDRLFYYSLLPFASVSLAVVLLLLGILLWKSMPALERYGPTLFTESRWSPNEEEPELSVYGLLVPLAGTLVTAVITVLLALPLSVSLVIFSEEMLPWRLRGYISTIVDVMAGIPTIVYGLWGLTFLAPLLREKLFPVLYEYLGWLPMFSCEPRVGTTVLTASLVLAVMVIPYMFAVVREAYRSIPYTFREAALSLGTTRYEAVRILLSMVRPAVIAAALLGFGRAAGETVAVALVIGLAAKLPTCLLNPSYTISSLIAVQFGEAGLYPYMENALYAGGLVLLVIGLAANVLGLKLLGRSRYVA